MTLEIDGIKQRLALVEQRLWPSTVPTPHGTVQEWDRRRHVPALSEFSPEDTDHGSTKLPPGMFQAIQQRVAQLEAEKAQATAYAAGQENVRREIEKASEKRWKNAQKWVAVLVPLIALIFTGVGFLIKHMLDK